jgi:hypothetical protein
VGQQLFHAPFKTVAEEAVMDARDPLHADTRNTQWLKVLSREGEKEAEGPEEGRACDDAGSGRGTVVVE